MVRNKMSNLADTLFAQLEYLDDSENELKIEIERSKAMVSVAGQIVSVGKLAIDAKKLDGDKTNVDISNLACVNRSDIAQMNKNRYFDSDPETTKAAIGLVQLQRKVKEITNGNTL